MQHPRPRPRARGNSGFLLASNNLLLASASTKINRPSTATLEKPRSPFPIFWNPDHTAPGTALIGLGGASAKTVTTVYLHRLIMGAGPGDLVDHKDGERLDCRRTNLRLVDRAENNANRGFTQTPLGTAVLHISPRNAAGRRG